MILRIEEATVIGPSSLRVRFNDGAIREVDLLPMLQGPVFDLLRDPSFFAKVSLDPISGTIAWPNGADFAPESLDDQKPEPLESLE